MKHWNENKRAGLATSKTLGNTNTHQDVANLVVEQFIDWDVVDETTRFLEPSVGMGSFYLAIADKLLAKGIDFDTVFSQQIVAADVDAKALAMCRQNIHDAYGPRAAELAVLHHTDFLGDFWPETTFDFIVANPPYISFGRMEPPFGGERDPWLEGIQKRLKTTMAGRADAYAWFHTKALEMLSPDGLCVFLCSDSWVDGAFGDTLKTMILDGGWQLERLLNSQAKPFFRDDTNAVITTIRRLQPNTPVGATTIDVWRAPQWGTTESTETHVWSRDEMDDILRGPGYVNRRNALFLFPRTYAAVDAFFQTHVEAFERVEDAYTLRTSAVGSSHFDKTTHIRSDVNTLPVFWQLQARINRKPDYRTHVPAQDLAMWVPQDATGPNGKPVPVVTGNVFLSTIVDRFPLVFWTDAPSVHVSKYVALTPVHTTTQAIAAAALESLPAVLSLEQTAKEGTRKTLRKGEFGLAKEMSKSDITAIQVPRLNAFAGLETPISAYQNRVIYNLEDALIDPDYWAVQVAVAHKLGYATELERIAKMATFLYVLRMRHLEKLKNFDAWYKNTHGDRIALSLIQSKKM